MVSLDSFEQTFSKQIAHIELLAEINVTLEDVEQLRQCVADFMKADDVERAMIPSQLRSDTESRAEQTKGRISAKTGGLRYAICCMILIRAFSMHFSMIIKSAEG